MAAGLGGPAWAGEKETSRRNKSFLAGNGAPGRVTGWGAKRPGSGSSRRDARHWLGRFISIVVAARESINDLIAVNRDLLQGLAPEQQAAA